jgi:Flp pilus assembly protein TadG
MAAILAVPLIAAAGIAVDFARAGAERARAQSALDAAVLAGARALDSGRTEAAATARALAVYRTNFRPNAAATFTIANGVVTGVVRDSVPTTLSRVIGRASLPLMLRAAASSRARGIELAIVVDVSGSMTSHIPALRSAATRLLDVVYGTSNERPDVFVGLAPFSGRVNVINYGASWLTGAPTMTNGPTGPVGNSCKVNSVNVNYPRLCPQRRAAPLDQDDTPPSGGLFNEYTSTWVVCPVPRTIGLSRRRSDVQPFVDGLCAGHGTSTYEGLAWGWRMVSPRWKGLWGDADLPKSYAESPGKFVVIMTDGVNHPNQSGDPLTTVQADAKLLQTCTAMKAEGITILAVTYNMNGALTSLYQQCASHPKYQFDAESAAELNAVFAEIGKIVSTGELRLLK